MLGAYPMNEHSNIPPSPERLTAWVAGNCGRVATEGDIGCDCAVDVWHKAEYVPASTADRLASAAIRLLDSLNTQGTNAKELQTEVVLARQNLREALAIYRDSASKEDQ